MVFVRESLRHLHTTNFKVGACLVASTLSRSWRALSGRDDLTAETQPIGRCDNLLLLDVPWDFDTP